MDKFMCRLGKEVANRYKQDEKQVILSISNSQE